MKQVIIELVRQNRRMLIAAGILLLLNLVLQVTVSSYLNPAVVSAQASWNDLRQRVAVLGRTDVQSVYQRGIDDLRKITERTPLKRQFPRLLGDILDAAATSNVTASGISYKAVTGKERAAKEPAANKPAAKEQPVRDQELLQYEISLSVAGGYAAVKSFLADLQKFNELIVVDSVSLSNSDLFEENVSMALKLSVYFRGEGA